MNGPPQWPEDGTRPLIPPNLRVYAFGDIHGRADLLFEKLKLIFKEQSAEATARALLVFIGDYIDRGAQSSQVIEMILSVGRRIPTVCLAGNHELYALRFLSDPATGPAWFKLGGRATLESYGVAIPTRLTGSGFRQMAKSFREALPDPHLHLLRSLGLTFSIGDYVFVHAGLSPSQAIAETPPVLLTTVRDPLQDVARSHGRIVVHGHTPVAEVDLAATALNIDTGAYMTDRLTCLVLEGASRRLI